MHSLTVKQDGLLFDFLLGALHGIKRTKLKDYLASGAIKVNGKIVTKASHSLQAGDAVALQTDKQEVMKEKQKSDINVVYEDDTLIVINKPSGLLTIATEKEQKRTAYYGVHRYLQNGNPNNKKPVFIVHRLDQFASGLLVFAKTAAAKMYLQENWHHFVKRYFAVVRGTPARKQDTIVSWLTENQFLKVHTSPYQTEDSKRAVTHYRVLESGRDASLVEVELETGRKHQIRVHLASIGHPILGDDRYGGKDNAKTAARLALHSYYLSISHPKTGKNLKFQTEQPREFAQFLKARLS